mgnify:CR=1 FL=1
MVNKKDTSLGANNNDEKINKKIEKQFLKEMLKNFKGYIHSNNDVRIPSNEKETTDFFDRIKINDYRYNRDSKKWMIYDNVLGIWTEEKAETFLELEMRVFFQIYSDYVIKSCLSGIKKKEMNDFQKSLKYNMQNLSTVNGRRYIINDYKTLCSCNYNDFDNNINLLNCKNGTLNLKTLEFKKHDPKDMLTKSMNVIYDKNVKSLRWTAFIQDIMTDPNNNDDAKMRENVRYLQKLLGYILTGKTVKEQMYIFYGMSTRNGKSTLVETIKYLMGSYAMTAQPDLISKKTIDSRAPSEDIARLKGARVVFMSEPIKGQIMNCAMVKQFVGGDTITARKLNESSFEFIPTFKLIMNTNHLPEVYDNTIFSGDKMVIIPFRRHFSEEERDLTLKEQLRSEENLSAIFNWMIAGLKMFYKEDLKLTGDLKEAIQQFENDSNKIKQFIDDCLIYDENKNGNGAEMYEIYKKWCTKNGYSITSNRVFYTDLASMGIIIDSGKVNGKKCRKRVKNYVVANPFEYD